MKIYEATEARAYNDGYEQGKKDVLKWISVTERLPEHANGHVLVTDGMRVKISCRNACYKTASGETRCAQAYGAGMCVTHWMPLPEPPKEAQE